MSSPGLTSSAQLRYLLQWFGEFSELQREDFLPILVAASQGKPDQLASILASLSCEDKPVSLFQCRIKLFNEWFPTWAEEEQHRLIKGCTDMDAEFGQKLQDLLTNGPKVNGDTNGFFIPDVPGDKQAADKNVDSQVPENIEEQNEDQIGESVPNNNIPVEIVAA